MPHSPEDSVDVLGEPPGSPARTLRQPCASPGKTLRELCETSARVLGSIGRVLGESWESSRRARPQPAHNPCRWDCTRKVPTSDQTSGSYLARKNRKASHPPDLKLATRQNSNPQPSKPQDKQAVATWLGKTARLPAPDPKLATLRHPSLQSPNTRSAKELTRKPPNPTEWGREAPPLFTYNRFFCWKFGKNVPVFV